MKKNTLRADSIFAFLSILSLLYIYYYTTVFYYKAQGTYLDFAYEYLAVPGFYFFVSAFVVTVLCSLFGFRGLTRIQSRSSHIIVLILIIYILFVVLKKTGVIVLLPILFGSGYCIVYFILGCFFAFAFYKDK